MKIFWLQWLGPKGANKNVQEFSLHLRIDQNELFRKGVGGLVCDIAANLLVTGVLLRSGLRLGESGWGSSPNATRRVTKGSALPHCNTI